MRRAQLGADSIRCACGHNRPAVPATWPSATVALLERPHPALWLRTAAGQRCAWNYGLYGNIETWARTATHTPSRWPRRGSLKSASSCLQSCPMGSSSCLASGEDQVRVLTAEAGLLGVERSHPQPSRPGNLDLLAGPGSAPGERVTVEELLRLLDAGDLPWAARTGKDGGCRAGDGGLGLDNHAVPVVNSVKTRIDPVQVLRVPVAVSDYSDRLIFQEALS